MNYRLCVQKEDGSLKDLSSFTNELEAKKAVDQYPAVYTINVYCVEERRGETLKRRWWLQHGYQHGILAKRWALEKNPKPRPEAVDPPLCDIILYYNQHEDRDHVVQELCIDKRHHIWRKAATYAAPPFTNWMTTAAKRVGDCDGKICENFSDGERTKPVSSLHWNRMRLPEEFLPLIQSQSETN